MAILVFTILRRVQFHSIQAVFLEEAVQFQMPGTYSRILYIHSLLSSGFVETLPRQGVRCTCCLSGVQNDSGPHYKLMCKSILHIDAQIYRKFILSATAIFWTTTCMMLIGITLAGPHCRSDNKARISYNVNLTIMGQISIIIIMITGTSTQRNR